MKKVFVIIISVLVLKSCTSEQPEVLTRGQTEMFGYLPAESQFVMYMNFSELRKTEFWESFFEPSILSDTTNNWLSDFEAHTGAGLNNGISEVVSATTWNGNDVFVVRFAEGFEQVKSYFLNEEKFTSDTISGAQVFLLSGNTNAKFYFPAEDILLIVKSDKYLRSVINGVQQNLNEDNTLLQVIGKIENKNHYWMVTSRGEFTAALFSLLAENTELPVRKLISSVKGISLSAKFDEGVDIAFTFRCSDSESAHLLSTAIRSSLAAGLLTGMDKSLNEIIKNLDIDRDEENLYLKLNLNQDELADLKRLTGLKKSLKQL